MARDAGGGGHPVLRFRRSELVIGPKVWLALATAAVIIVIGALATPSNVWAGAGIGVGGVLGALLGILIQFSPREKDLSATGASAVRGLLGIAEDVENAQIVATQLSRASSENERVMVGLVNVQDRLAQVRVDLYRAMAEWDAVIPGSMNEVQRLRDEGRRALELFAKENETDD